MRKNRDIAPGLPNHFVLRANNRRRLFSYESEYRQFLAFLDDARLKYGCLIHALALLANHLHMMVTPPTVVAGWKLVQSCAQRYAQWRNRRRDGSGKLFEQRFTSVPI